MEDIDYIIELESKISALTKQLMEEYAESHSANSRKVLIDVLGEEEFYANLVLNYDLECSCEREDIARLIRR